MQIFSPQAADTSLRPVNFGTFGAIFTLVLLPFMCFLTIPAIIFAKKAKTLYERGNYNRSLAFAKKAKRYTLSAWAITFITALTLFALYFISRLSLI
ncbi:MAG: CD225/dispanin family protein [Clostridia bacterium]|nr:CD225/dispanin family protein [Clostridia bacterium]